LHRAQPEGEKIRVQNIYTNDTGVINGKSITQVTVTFGILIGL
jgi:hypothetical protein